jgi:hypothetical protein
MENEIKALEKELVNDDTNTFLPSKIDEMNSIEDLKRVISELEDEQFIVSSAEKKNAYWAMPLLVLYFLLIIRGNSKIEDAISSRQRVDEIKEKQMSVREKVFELKIREEFKDTPIQNYMKELWDFGKPNKYSSYYSMNRDDLFIAYPLFSEYLSLYYNKVPQSLAWGDFVNIYDDFKTFLKTNFPDVFRHGTEMKEADKQERESQKQNDIKNKKAKKIELRNQTIINMKEYFQHNSILSEIDVVTKMRSNANYEFINQNFPFINTLYANGLLSKADKYYKNQTYYYIEFLKQNFEDIIYEAKSILLLEHENEVKCDQDIDSYIDRIKSKFSFIQKTIMLSESLPLRVFADEDLFVRYLEAYYPGTREVSYYHVKDYEDYLKKIPEQRKKYKLLERE